MPFAPILSFLRIPVFSSGGIDIQCQRASYVGAPLDQ